MSFPSFTTGEVLTAADMNAVGMWLIKTATVTNAADSGTTWDNVFTSDYSTYVLHIASMNAHTAGSIPQIQFRYAGPTTQAAAYYSGIQGITYLGGETTVFRNNQGMGYLGIACDATSNGSGVVTFNRLSANPNYVCQFNDYQNLNWSSGGGTCTTSRTYTGFLLSMSAGNISVTASLYGMKK